MCFTKENVDHVCQKLVMVLKEIEGKNMNSNANMKKSVISGKKETLSDSDDSGVSVNGHHGFVNGQEYVAVHPGDNDSVPVVT